MALQPVSRMQARIRASENDSDAALFNDLMYFGEMVTKLVVSVLVALISDDVERSQYRQAYQIVRSDGLGAWSTAIDELLTGPTSRHLITDAAPFQRELLERRGSSTWQYEAAAGLHRCIGFVSSRVDPFPDRVDGRRWLKDFVQLRNRKSHGALPADTVSRLCKPLRDSIEKFLSNCGLLKLQWAFLHRNLSGKYRVAPISDDVSAFEILKSRNDFTLLNGVYIHLGRYIPVRLIESNGDASDFFFPNGSFNDKNYELLSYITGETIPGDSAPYLIPPGQLPESETHGFRELEIQGKSIGNVPTVPKDYISRHELETEIREALCSDRHPVVTLVGRGGIGKTSVSLAALRELSIRGEFFCMIWFSARDLDLLIDGPKPVRPAVVNVRDMASELVRLFAPKEANEKGFKVIDYFAQQLGQSEFGRMLYVFDNFETVTSPAEVFRWIDGQIRPPNKALITTRFRDFRGDYPIEVSGMTESECLELINTTASRLDISNYLTNSYKEQVIRESEGHPYVVKIMLGEVAKARKLVPVQRIVANADEILTALFERTFRNLSPGANRVFLTLCHSGPILPALIIEATILNRERERVDVKAAIDELEKTSFVEVERSEADKQAFVIAPLAANTFGKRKLSVSAIKSAVEAESVVLKHFSVTQRREIQYGISRGLDRFFKHCSNEITNGRWKFEEVLPLLEMIARSHYQTWLKVSLLYEELALDPKLEGAKEALRRFLEQARPDEAVNAWRRLRELCQMSKDVGGELHAIVELCSLAEVDLLEISSAVNRFNSLVKFEPELLDTDEKRIMAGKLATVMSGSMRGANADDISRLAWLYLQLRQPDRARSMVTKGLELDPMNDHCLRLKERLDRSVRERPGTVRSIM